MGKLRFLGFSRNLPSSQKNRSQRPRISMDFSGSVNRWDRDYMGPPRRQGHIFDSQRTVCCAD